jgi:hypothetical protein
MASDINQPKEREFNLSEKIEDVTGSIDAIENIDAFIDIEDVKEFIKTIKMHIAPYSPYIDIIDKFAGDKLI